MKGTNSITNKAKGVFSIISACILSLVVFVGCETNAASDSRDYNTKSAKVQVTASQAKHIEPTTASTPTEAIVEAQNDDDIEIMANSLNDVWDNFVSGLNQSGNSFYGEAHVTSHKVYSKDDGDEYYDVMVISPDHNEKGTDEKYYYVRIRYDDIILTALKNKEVFQDVLKPGLVELCKKSKEAFVSIDRNDVTVIVEVFVDYNDVDRSLDEIDYDENLGPFLTICDGEITFDGSEKF